MVYKKTLDSPINTLYFLTVVIGFDTYSKMINFLDNSFGKNFKQGNIMKTIKKLIDEGYIDIKKTNVLKLISNKNMILKDIYHMLFDITDKFTYTFKMNGKTITKKKVFSYNDKCTLFYEDIKTDFGNQIFSIFEEYCKKVILHHSGYDNVVDRKTSNLSYEKVIKEFIIGFAINESFIDEYDNYLDGYIETKNFNLRVNKKKYNNFKELCKIYLNIISLTDLSLISGKIKKIIHQD